MVILTNLLVIFLMIAVGFAAGRLHLVNESAQGDFTSLLMNVALPATILGSMIREYDPAMIMDSILIFVLSLIFFGGFLLINPLLAKIFRVPKEKTPVWVVSAALCNCGFMGFPLTLALFGEDGLFLAAILNVAYNCVSWTIGAKQMCMNQSASGSTDWKKIIFTMPNLAVVFGLTCFLGQIPVPAPVLTVVNSFGNITTPLSMFLIGLSLSGGKLAEVFTDRDAFSVSAVRLILIPVIVAMIMRLLPLREGSLLPGVLTLILAMPCPSVSMMLALQYGEDSAFAARGVFLSSLLCIVTIPLIMMLV